MTDSNVAECEEIVLKNKQQASAQLRQGFLRSIQVLSGSKCSILTYEKSALEAEFLGWNNNGDELLVQDLKTPTGQVIATALLRVPDVLYIKFDKSL